MQMQHQQGGERQCRTNTARRSQVRDDKYEGELRTLCEGVCRSSHSPSFSESCWICPSFASFCRQIFMYQAGICTVNSILASVHYFLYYYEIYPVCLRASSIKQTGHVPYTGHDQDIPRPIIKNNNN